MKQITKLTLLLLALLIPATALSYDFEVDGIYYNINGTEATVTYKGSNDWNHNTYSGDVTIPSSVTYDGTTYTVTTIGEWAFSDCSGLTNITIPNSVTTIGEWAFYDCSGLTSITIPNSVTTIGFNAFDGTAWFNNQPDGLIYAGLVAYRYKGTMPEGTSITLQDGTKGIAGGAFSYRIGLASISIPNSVISIGYRSFDNCRGLMSISIPNSISRIDSCAFNDCRNLANITVANDNPNYDSRNNCNAIIETATNTLIVGCKNTIIPNTVTGIGDDAFYGCSDLTSVTLPSSVTTIGEFAFDGCDSLTNVTIPNSVTSIGFGAFFGTAWFNNQSDGLIYVGNVAYYYKGTMPEGTSITLREGTKGIAGGAFLWCSGLTEIIIPNSVTSIGHSAFQGTRLTSIALPDSVTSISSWMFSYCSRLTSITIPNYVTEIGDGAFEECSRLSNISIPNSVTTIGDRAFSGCRSLINISIGDNLKFIGERAFQYCEKLTSITIPNSVTSIGVGAFSECYNLTNINIPNSISNIAEAAFRWCSLTSVTIPNSVTYIGKCAFAGNGLTDLIIPNSVLTIEEEAFRECFRLTNLTLGNSLMYIGASAFEYCDSLATITIPNSVISIGENAFYGCNGLTSITIPNSVTSIGSSAFYGCGGLTSITIPNSVTTIGESAFGGCSGLTSITVESGNTNYDSRNNCNALIETATNTLINGCQNTVIPNSVTTIGENAFYGCNGLTSITIPNSVTSIGSSAFYGCSSLTSITIPNSITSIGSSAFYGCSGLTSIIVDSGNPNYDSRNNCNAIIETATNTLIHGCQNTFIPNSITTIGNSAFSGCSGLTSITIPNSVITIGDRAFSGCSGLTSITIPNSVTTIGKRAFWDCSSLNDLYSYISDLSQLSMGEEVFYRYPDNYGGRTLYVPIGTSAAYQANSKWKKYFGNIVEIEPVPAAEIKLDKTAAVVIEGQTLQLMATVEPHQAYNKSVLWYSSNPAVATVDENGLVSAHEVGTATITAVTTDGTNLSAACTITVRSLSADNCFSLPDVEVLHGETITIPVQMTNQESIMAFQTDICLPEGFTLVTNEDNEPLITPSSRLTSDHVIMADILNDGSVRVICYTLRSKVISGNEGDLFYITVAVPEDASGDYAIYLRNSLLTTTDYTELSIPDAGAVIKVKTFIPGDVNDSHSVTVTDIVVTAQYILQRNPSPFIFDAADMNGDGNISVTDIMLIARLVMTPTANAPMRMPALAANDDCLSGEGITISMGETRRMSIALDNVMVYSAFQLDLNLPQGLTASNFALTDRAGSHVLDVQALSDGKLRALCYSPVIEPITGSEGALLTFDVTASGPVTDDITVDGIEMVTTSCQTVLPQAFTIPVNNTTAVTEASASRTVARVDYYNAAGQRLDAPATGLTIIVTTYTDGTHTTSKIFHQ